MIVDSRHVQGQVQLDAHSRGDAAIPTDNRGRNLTALAADAPANREPAGEGAATRESRHWEYTRVADRTAEADIECLGRRCQRCQCVLSRYNEDPYCSTCSRRVRHRPDPVPSVPITVWARTDVQEALCARDFGMLCHLVRVAGSLRQSDMAELTGLSQAFLSMLESGARRLTNIDKIVELLAGLDAPAELTGPMLRIPGLTDEPDWWQGARSS